MRQFAQGEMLNKAKQPEESTDEFVARCWFNAFLISLQKNKYKLCVEKNSEMYYLQEQ
jgi:hypothetical protein